MKYTYLFVQQLFANVSQEGVRSLKTTGILSLFVTILAGISLPRAVVAEESYFYSGGKKQPLRVSEKWVAAQADDSANVEDLKTQPSFDKQRRSGRVHHDVLIAPVKPGTSRAERENLERALKGKRGVKRSLRAYDTTAGTPIVETGNVLVQFRPEITREQASAIFAEHGAEIVRPLGPYAPNGYVARVTDATRNATDVANAIFERGVAIFSHPDLLAPSQRHYVPNDPRFEDQWYLNNPGSLQPPRKTGADIKAQRAWDLTRGSSNVTVAVLDDGFDLTHEEFQNGKVVYSYDYFSYDNDASPDAFDNHGTACAGLIAATADNAKGISGVAPECKLILLKVGKTQGPTEPNPGATLFGSQTLADAFTAAADRGASVISCSWEFLLFDSVKAAIHYAATQGRGGLGCVIFFSSGNDGAAITNEHAKLPEVIAVGATTALDERASYSNFGPELDLVAPSSPQAFVGGTLDVLTTDRVGAPGYRDGDYASFGGTSAACPIAAGVGALVISKEPGLTRDQVHQRLISTTDKIDPENAGYKANGFSETYGYGRVNALRAVAASDTTPPTLTISTPEDNAYSREITAISGYAYDGGLLEPTIDLVIYQDGKFWNGFLWVDHPEGQPIPVAFPKPQVDANGYWTYTNLPTGADLRSGIYHINASVYDAAGNANTPTPGTNSLSYRIDRSPPNITIASPANGTVYTDLPHSGWFHGTASDDGSTLKPEITVRIRRVNPAAYWAGGSWMDLESFGSLATTYTGETAWICSSSLPGIGADNSRCMAAGEYELIAIAQDKAGNQAETRINITVEHTLTLPDVPFLTEQPTPLVQSENVAPQNGLNYSPLPQDDSRIQSPRFLRVDPAGNYITGMSMAQPVGQYITPHPSTAIFKHNKTTGEQIWRRERLKQSVTVQSEGLESTRYYERFAEEQEWMEIDSSTYDGMYSLAAMETDAEGNVYVALDVYQLQYRQYAISSSGSPLFAYIPTPVNVTVAVKFDTNGNLVWRRTIGVSSLDTLWHPNSHAMSIKPLADGSALVLISNTQFVSGSTYFQSYSYGQTVLARIGTINNGFVKHFGYEEITSTPLEVGLDSTGDVYLVSSEGARDYGYYYATPAPDHIIRKLDQSGTVLKEVRIDHCDAPETWTDMAVDPATGHLYIAGNHTISNEPTGRQVAMKFDLGLPEGDEMVWRTFAADASTASSDRVFLGLSAEGIFLGSNARTSFSGRTYITVSRISYAGLLSWNRKYSSPQPSFGSNSDTMEAMAVDAEGNVYMLGYAPGENGLSQAALRKVSSKGDVQFEKLLPVGVYHEYNFPEILLLPGSTTPASLAFLAQSPAPGSIQLFSNPAVVYPPITIPEFEPADLRVAAGATATLAVNASGSAPLSYQWRKHTAGGSIQDIPDATGPALTFSNAQLGDAGQYSVVVSNGVVTPVTSRIATLTVEVVVPLEEALDGSGFTWVTGGAQPWAGSTAVAYDGVDSARSGTTANSENSWLETTVTGPGVLSFRWKVSSEENYDHLRVYLDGALQAGITGEQDWAAYGLFISEVTHTVRWAYEKDSSRASGQDQGWIDDVNFTPGTATPPEITAHPVSVTTAKGRFVSFSVTASGVGALSYQWLKGDQEIEFATDATFVVPFVTDADVGNYRVRVTAAGQSVLSNTATLTISDDATKPTIRVTTPSKDVVVTAPEFTLSGTAADNREVASVSVYIERPNGEFSTYMAAGTTNWSATVTLNPGINTITAYSTDAAGNYSALATRKVTYQTTVTLTVNHSGEGAVFEAVGKALKPVQPTSQRLTGKPVKLVAKPVRGFICAGWSVGNSSDITVPGATYNAALSGDLTVTARFIPTPYPALAGTYSGVIESIPATPTLSGGFTLTMTSTGMLTGKLTLGNRLLPIKAALDANVALTGVIKIPGGAPMNYTIQFTETGVTGSLSLSGVSIAQFTGVKVLTFTKTNTPAVEGRYTLLLDNEAEANTGHALVQVTKTGKVTITGTLTAGDKFILNGALCAGNRVSVYVLMRGAGKSVIGWITFAETPEVSDIQGSLTRFPSLALPAVQLTATGSKQTATADAWLLEELASSNGAAKLTFAGAGLTTPLEQNVTIGKVVSKRGKLSTAITLPNPNTNALTLKIDPLTGSITGRFKPTATSPFVNFSGVLFQKQNLGEARFEIGEQIGTVTLLPAVQ